MPAAARAEDQRVAVGECPQALDRAAGADPDLEQAVLLPNRDLELRESVGASELCVKCRITSSSSISAAGLPS